MGVKQFLSTPSARRATGSHHPHRPQVAISIHALREEGDRKMLGQRFRLKLFLSTPSARRATYGSSYDYLITALFLSTPSARRATG